MIKPELRRLLRQWNSLNNPKSNTEKSELDTPDEEIGRGASFDVTKFGADGLHLDGSQVGELEYENFNAAGAKITFKGKSVHPGYAKGR
jgi:tripeptide aminopeptidase